MPGSGQPGNASVRSQEIKRRMRTRFTWIVAVLALVAVGFLMACSTKYKSSSNGLVVVPTQGSAVMQTFSLNLSNGHVSQINNSAGPPTPGLPGAVILDPAGAFAYVATTVDCTPTLGPNTSLTAVQGAIVTYKIDSDGKLAAGSTQFLQGNPAYPSTFPTCGLDDTTNPNAGSPAAAMAIDSAGKFLFVAIASGGATYTTNLDTVPISTVATLDSVGIEVFAIGANATLTEVSGSPFVLPGEAGGGGSPAPSALAVTPTAFPIEFASCSGHSAPSTENLYVTDSVNNALLNYTVSSAGVLMLVPASAGSPGVLTGSLPSGVAVDSCGQFVYVANSTSNSVSAFTICTAVSQNCLQGDYSLRPVSGSPYPAGDKPGPIAIDPFAKYVYVVDHGSSQVSGFRISPSDGSLTTIAGTPVPTNSGPNSIAIRSDGAWIFVANFDSANVSQYAITQATGALTSQAPFTTLNQPTGVAVK
jgi:6-phosphogluconolactonase (cycloisomerase 2 family)